MAISNVDFRVRFSRMDRQAIVTKDELAALLAVSARAVQQMAYRGELPEVAFPNKRRSCWFVGDIRAWLDEAAMKRANSQATTRQEGVKPRIGRPRHAVVD
jgi:hypothetical protein